MSNQSDATQSSVERVVEDIVDLCELQIELLSVDSQEARRELKFAAACAVAGMVLACSAMTVTIVGLAVVLAELTPISMGFAFIIVSAICFMVVAGLGWKAFMATKRASHAMRETKSEFVENLRWLKATILSPKTSARNLLRRNSFNHYQAVSAEMTGWKRSGPFDY